MTIRVALQHETRYRYDRPVVLGPQVIRLRPASHSRTPVPAYALHIDPPGHFVNWQQDPFGNFQARAVFPDKVREFVVRVDLIAEIAVYNPFDFFLEEDTEHYPFDYADAARRDLDPYLRPAPAGPRLQAWLAELGSPPRQGLVDFLVMLNQRLAGDIRYMIRMEPGFQAPDETLTLGSGSCRDGAWLLVQILRHLGIAARFVSGYLIQLKADQKSLGGPSGTESDVTDLHAWAEAFLPGAGWVGLDPTSGLLTGEGHIPLAATPHPSTAAPISGSVEASACDFSFTMSVQRLEETPRVTLPYTDEQYREINKLGEFVYHKLEQSDVRLTVAGEPTFVAVDYPDEAEWNTEAVGPHKRRLATELIERLARRFSPQGVLHHGQGEWYLGEQLPRWALTLIWRADGEPVCTDMDFLARVDAADGADAGPCASASAGDAEALGRGVASALGLDAEAVLPAYEEPWHTLAEEGRALENLTPETHPLDDPHAREGLTRLLGRGLGEPVGYVLPALRWNAGDTGGGWITEHWRSHSGRLLLLPGDSPIGYRLRLDSLPQLPATAWPHVVPQDPFAPREPLPRAGAVPPGADGAAAAVTPADSQPQPGAESDRPHGNVRTALAFEVRDGVLHAFIPPVETAEHYLDLLTAIERAARAVGKRVIIEGHLPPPDPRLQLIKVTPAPGVIEVTIPPASSWSQLNAITSALYEEARATRLDTQKFMLDGRHTGTGGGNHLVLGGATAADSPFLRRPDLLRSLVACWQQHPALSYLFSGLLIGPTGQSPRVDEARTDSLYELELAFEQIPEPEHSAGTPPWLVDRVLRNLLVDVSGSTHRAEICIDRLYSPHGPTGRLGLVEFRAFEMPPHARMSVVQQLLLVALVMHFWRTPNSRPLVRWGTALNDRFMLPHFIWQDLRELLSELRAGGFDFDPAWFAPHFEFRFPRFGSIAHAGVELELRQALEPWHAMGEAGAIGGSTRAVDSSLERLQVRVSGFSPERYLVACNGQRVPLVSASANGEYVAGVRFRAWQSAASLHPTIPVDAPLHFDLYDRWNGRPVAGCTYHVAHPGGRNFEYFPVNANEAESRRLSRFQPGGHSAGGYAEPPCQSGDEFPTTLDLRR